MSVIAGPALSVGAQPAPTAAIEPAGDDLSPSPQLVDVQASNLPGSGTNSDPYQISNVSELQAMEDDPSANYELVSDIDASNTSKFNNGSGFDPVGTRTTTEFSGSLDGKNNTITGLTINRPSGNEYVGLFGAINSGTVRDITLNAVAITGDFETGGVAGRVQGNGRIQNVRVSGAVSSGFSPGGLAGEVRDSATVQNVTATVNVTADPGDSSVGGLIGQVRDSATVSNAVAHGNVTGVSGVGGLVGTNDGTVRNARATGNVQGKSLTGGLVGTNGGTIRNATATGRVVGGVAGGLVGRHDGDITGATASGRVIGTPGRSNATAGGLIGRNGGSIRDSTASGDVSGEIAVGGLIGRNDGFFGSGIGVTQNVAASGSVTGSFRVGGLIGRNNGPVRNATASGSVTGVGRADNLGGLIGRNNASVRDATASGRVSGNEVVGGLIGTNRAPLRRVTASGTVTSTAPASERGVGGLVGVNIATVRNATASGSVDGNNSLGGLVGVNADGIINDSTASGNVTGTNSTGGLIGRNYGTVRDSTASGSVDGNNSLGGLIGVHTSRIGKGGALVLRSSASGGVNGTTEVGGLVGFSNSIINSSRASGTVTGESDVGGLVGAEGPNSQIRNSTASNTANIAVDTRSANVSSTTVALNTDTGARVNVSALGLPSSGNQSQAALASDVEIVDGNDTVLTSLNITVSKSVSATLSFTVEKSNISGDPTDLLVTRFTNGSYDTLTTTVVENASDTVTIEAQTPGFSRFTIVDTNADSEPPEESTGPTGDDVNTGGDSGGSTQGVLAVGERSVTHRVQVSTGAVEEVTVGFDQPATGRVQIESVSGFPTGAPTPEGEVLATVGILPPDDVANLPGSIELTVTQVAVSDIGVDPSDLRIVRYNDQSGELESLETSVVTTTDQSVVVSAETPGFSVFGVVATSQQRTTPTATATSGGTATPSPEPELTPTSTPTSTPPPTATPTPTTTSTGAPGFGPIVAIVAVITAGVIFWRRN